VADPCAACADDEHLEYCNWQPVDGCVEDEATETWCEWAATCVPNPCGPLEHGGTCDYESGYTCSWGETSGPECIPCDCPDGLWCENEDSGAVVCVDHSWYSYSYDDDDDEVHVACQPTYDAYEACMQQNYPPGSWGEAATRKLQDDGAGCFCAMQEGSCPDLVSDGVNPDSACIFYTEAECGTKDPQVGCEWRVPGQEDGTAGDQFSTSMCLDAAGFVINPFTTGCTCHPSCATCGYKDLDPNDPKSGPIGGADCVTCANPEDTFTEVHSDGTGICGSGTKGAFAESSYSFSYGDLFGDDPPADGEPPADGGGGGPPMDGGDGEWKDPCEACVEGEYCHWETKDGCVEDEATETWCEWVGSCKTDPCANGACEEQGLICDWDEATDSPVCAADPCADCAYEGGEYCNWAPEEGCVEDEATGTWCNYVGSCKADPCYPYGTCEEQGLVCGWDEATESQACVADPCAELECGEGSYCGWDDDADSMGCVADPCADCGEGF
jgi:hypothetical protein